MLLKAIVLLLVYQYYTVSSNGNDITKDRNNCSRIYDYLMIGGTTYIGSSLIKRIKHLDPSYSILIINHLLLGDVNYLKYDNGSLSVDLLKDVIVGDLGNLDIIKTYIRCSNTLFHVLDFDHMSSHKKQIGIHKNVLQIASGAGITNYIEINKLFCLNINYLIEFKTNLGFIARSSAMKIKVFRVFNIFGKGMHLDKLEQKHTIPMLIKQALTSLTGIVNYQEAFVKPSLSYIYVEDLISTIFQYLQNDVVLPYTDTNHTKSHRSIDEMIVYLNTAITSAEDRSAVNIQELQIAHMITDLTNYALRYTRKNSLVPCFTAKYHSMCGANHQVVENSNTSLHLFLPKQPVYNQLMFEKGLVQVFLDVSMRLGSYLRSMSEEGQIYEGEHWNDEYGMAHEPFIDWVNTLEVNFRKNGTHYMERFHDDNRTTTDIELQLLNVLKNISSISVNNNRGFNGATCSENKAMNYITKKTVNSTTNITTTSIVFTRKKLIFQQYEEDSEFYLPYYHSYIKLLNISYDICRCSTFESCSIKCGKSDVYLIGQSIMNKLKYKNYLSATDASRITQKTKCIAVFLNKEYESLKRKLRFIYEINANVAFTHHHNVSEFTIATHIPFIHIPFATNVNEFNIFALHNTKVLPYIYDISTSGHNYRVPWRLWYNNTGIEMLNNIGIHAAVAGWVQNVSEYVQNVAISKMWVATLSESDLVPPRVFDVMATNRTLLFVNRPNDSRVLQGILIENQHCILFTSNDEFVEKVIYYSTHESERLQIVSNAYDYALHHHDWTHRSLLILDALETCPKRNDNRKPFSNELFK